MLNWIKKIWNSIFGGSSGLKRSKLESLNDNSLLFLGDSYHGLDAPRRKYTDTVVKAGGHGCSVEISGLAESGPGGPVKHENFISYWKKQIDKATLLADDCQKSNLWLKCILFNTNPSVFQHVTIDEAYQVCVYFKEKLGKFNNVLLLVWSEFDKNTPRSLRDGLLKKLFGDHSKPPFWPWERTIQMSEENFGAVFHETHLSTIHPTIRDRPHFICVTDNGVTLEDRLDPDTFIKLALDVNSRNMSFDAYGKESTMPIDVWTKIGKSWK